MKDTTAAAPPRAYRQVRRAEATEATHRAIVDAFMASTRTRIVDAVTLDEVAAAAGVTVQTVIRRFGGKQGLLEAAIDRLEQVVLSRRAYPVGDIDAAAASLVEDYDHTGDMVLNWLAQEAVQPLLREPLACGRRGHREWVAKVFAPWLDGLAPRARDDRLNGLVVATDVYTWKILRRDMGLERERVVATIAALVSKFLGAPAKRRAAAGRSAA
ncbi:MAG: TetR/AcrR family transcriptional regulator [Alphaproteobacteria bacterium]|nr:TetR/AcrR family transcriptional regulator [Alphaproteobacteria bacterium]